MDNQQIMIVPAMHLFAISQYQARNDVRYYLNGLAIFPNRKEVVATDGYSMCNGRYDEKRFYWNQADNEEKEDFLHWILGDPNGMGKSMKLSKPKGDEHWAVIELDAETKYGVVKYSKHEKIEIILDALQGNYYAATQVSSFRLVTGEFPKYERIRPEYKEAISTTSVTLNAEFLYRASNTGRLIGKNKKGMTLHYPIDQGSCCEIEIDGVTEVTVLIMQMRSEVMSKGFLPGSREEKRFKRRNNEEI